MVPVAFYTIPVYLPIHNNEQKIKLQEERFKSPSTENFAHNPTGLGQKAIGLGDKCFWDDGNNEECKMLTLKSFAWMILLADFNGGYPLSKPKGVQPFNKCKMLLS